jgi:hypothetical protein
VPAASVNVPVQAPAACARWVTGCGEIVSAGVNDTAPDSSHRPLNEVALCARAVAVPALASSATAVIVTTALPMPIHRVLVC